MRKDWKLLVGTALLAIAVGVVAVTPLFGQGPRGGGRRGPGPPGGEFRGPGPPGGDDRGSRSPRERDRGRSDDEESRRRRYEGFLRSLDSNGDGRIDENEAEGRRRFFVERIAERAGVEAKFPISVRHLQDGLLKQSQAGGSSRTSSSGGSSGSDDKRSGGSSKEPLVPGFGVQQELAPVLKFGEAPGTGGSRRTQQPSSRDSSQRPSSSHSHAQNEGDDRVRRWAESMMRQQDRNRDGKLQREEWGGLRGDPRQIDRNHDGVITLDEMTARLNDYRRGGSGERDRRSDRPSDSRSSESGSQKWEGRKSYRFLSPTERWPEGLADWFARKDTDGDGQVAMAEYSSFWTTSMAIKFARYDLNKDGMITPGECLKAEENGAEPPKEMGETAKGETAKAETAKGEIAKGETAEPEKKDDGGMWAGW